MIRIVFCIAMAISMVAPGIAQTSAPTPATPTATPTPTQTVFVPKGALLVVQTTQAINSYGAKVGEKLRYEILNDFIVNGFIIAKAGDTAEGMVQEGQAGETGDPFFGIGQKAANLRVSVDKVYTFCGDTLLVYFDRSEFRQRQGLFGSHKDVEVVKGQKYVPFVDHPQKVCGEKTSAEPLPIPDDAIRSKQ